MTPAILRGHVPVAALLFDPALIGEEEARRRILALWSPGAVVLRCGDAYVLRLAKPQTMAAARAPGLPLVRRGSALAGFDLDDGKLSELGPLRDPTVVRFEEGTMTIVPLTENVEPADWLDLSAATLVETGPLGALPPPPDVVKPLEERDVRELLNVPPLAAPESMASLLAAIRSSNASSGSDGGGGILSHPESTGGSSRNGLRAAAIMIALVGLSIASHAVDAGLPPAIMIVFVLMLLSFLGWASAVRSWSAQPGAAVPESRADGGRGSGAVEQIFERVRRRPQGESRWRSALTRILDLTRLSSLIGRAQAKYLIKVLMMFEDNDLDAALRHAIPLGGAGGPSGIAWGTPTPRASLGITFGNVGGGPAIPIELSLMAELQRRYRAAFERLDQARRYDDAAFVLAELLRSNEEAVAYLEKRGQLRKAAQLAEARGLAPDLIVRQWMLAGDRNRAIAIARRFGAFASAVTRLEITHPETARALRGHWGAFLAAAGHYSTAIDVVWPVKELRGVAAVWIDRAIEQGGAMAGRMLVRRAIVRPEVRAETVAMLFELLAGEDPQRVAARAGAGTALLSEPLGADLRIAARAAIRAAVRDTPHGLEADQIRRLAQHARQDPLRTDLPALPRAETWSRNTFVDVVCEAADTGAMPVYAVAALTDGRVAVALGEGGVRVLSRDGRRVAHFDQPAYDLVISDARDRAIALVRRGGIVRLARIDFAARTAAYWCDADLGMYARDYDGASWFAARGREILQLDATAPRLEALWHNPEFPALVSWLARDDKQLCVLGRGGNVQRWRYELPSMTLRDRDELETPSSAILAVVSPAGAIFASGPEGGLVVRGKETTVVPDRVIFADRGHMLPRFAGNWLVAEAPEDERCDVYLCDIDGTTRAHFAFEGASRVAVTKQSGSLALADDRGRLLVLDLRRGVLTHNLRT